MSQFLGLDIQKEYEQNQTLKWAALCQIEYCLFECIFYYVCIEEKKTVFSVLQGTNGYLDSICKACS